MQEFDEQLHHWRDLERRAVEAETKLKGVQAANTPEFQAAVQEAGRLRKEADDYLYGVLGRVYRPGGDDPPA